MKYRVITAPLLLMALFLAVAPTAVASTTRYVNGVNGSDSNDCKSSTTACKTIGHAISRASAGDSIIVAAATYRENPSITKSLSIRGAGASITIIDGGAHATVVTISNNSAHVTLSNLTIQDGRSLSGAGPARGGGVYNLGTLTVNDCLITGNLAGARGFPAFGGGIYNIGTVTINNSTISGNRVSANGGEGGGIYNAGVALTNKSTINGNSASGPGLGGGIYNISGTLTINNSTISSNSAIHSVSLPGEGGGIYNNAPLTISNTTFSGNGATVGGGVFNSSGSTTVLQNSIVANNPAGGDCSGTITSHGFNLSSDGTCDLDGTGDLNNTNPLLGPLQNNGGPTQTMALLPGSPAIDAGNPTGCTDGLGHLLKTDQRGDPRPNKEDSGGCDMGAYERQSD